MALIRLSGLFLSIIFSGMMPLPTYLYYPLQYLLSIAMIFISDEKIDSHDIQYK